MIEQNATVVQVLGDSVLISTQRQSGCNSCNVKGGCGTSLIGQLFPNRPRQQLLLPLDGLALRPKAGDRVLIGIDEGYLQKTTLLLYLVPLTGLLLGALFGAYLGGLPGSLFGSELMSILFCLLGLSVGLWVTSRATANDSGRSAQAVKLLRIEPASLAVGIVGSTPSSQANKTSDTNQAN